MSNIVLKSAHCAVLDNVLYVHSPILRILWQALLRHTIPIKSDVLHALHDGIGDGIPSKSVIYCQTLHVSLVGKHDFAVCVYKLYHSYHNLCFQHLQIFSAYKNGSCAQTREEHLMLSNQCHFYGGGKPPYLHRMSCFHMYLLTYMLRVLNC
jgi:hypothetical protein